MRQCWKQDWYNGYMDTLVQKYLVECVPNLLLVVEVWLLPDDAPLLHLVETQTFGNDIFCVYDIKQEEL